MFAIYDVSTTQVNGLTVVSGRRDEANSEAPSVGDFFTDGQDKYKIISIPFYSYSSAEDMIRATKECFCAVIDFKGSDPKKLDGKMLRLIVVRDGGANNATAG